MIFDYLNENLQYALLYNYEAMAKVILIVSFLAFSIYFLFYKLKEFKQTDFIVVAFLRMYYVLVSFASVVLSPTFILLLNPAVSFGFVFKMFFGLYSLGLTFAMVLLLLDASKNTAFLFLEMAGLNTNSKSSQKLKNWIKNNKILKLRW